MREQLSQILIRFRPQLVDEIEPADLLNHLLAQNVLTKRQAKSISVSAILHLAYFCFHKGLFSSFTG